MSNTDLNLDSAIADLPGYAPDRSGMDMEQCSDGVYVLRSDVHEVLARRASPQPVAVDEQEFRTCCDHPDCTTCAGRGGFYRLRADSQRPSAAPRKCYVQGHAQSPLCDVCAERGHCTWGPAPSAQIADDHTGDDLLNTLRTAMPGAITRHVLIDAANEIERLRAAQHPSVPVQEQSDKAAKTITMPIGVWESWKEWGNAWLTVCGALNKAWPSWNLGKSNTIDSACNMIATLAKWENERRAQQSCPPVQAGAPMLLNADELAALRRFNECALDGECYDVPKEMMQRLAEIGVVRRKSGAYYEHTEYGLFVLDSTAHPAQDGEDAPTIPTWQERMLIDHPDLKNNLDGQIAWEVGNPYKDAEIADLRAELASRGGAQGRRQAIPAKSFDVQHRGR